MRSEAGVAPGPAPGPRAEPEFLPTLVASRTRRRRRSGLAASAVVHAAGLAAALLLPLFVTDELPASAQGLRVFLFEPIPPPPAPPPPPLPRGSGLVVKRRVPTPPTPEPPRERPAALVAPIPATDAPAPLQEKEGDPGGSVFGVPEGEEGGVEGGVAGGLPGGVVGGVLGGVPGSGPIPVVDYDRPPRPLHMPRPEYPHEAFVRKLEGTVLLQILIDEHGRVAEARVLRSIPLLDHAALAAVRLWIFDPARRGGRPVASIAMAPVTFQLY
jgi:protein TonB